MAIYIGTQKIDVSGVDKVYVGTQLVYQQVVPVYVTAISTSGQTTEYNLNDTFSYNGTCTATYSDGTTATVIPTASSPDMTTTGSKTVTLSYTEDGITVTTTYSITVYKVLSSIAISGYTTELTKGSSFSFGGTVTASYTDGSTANVTSSSTFSGYNMSTVDSYTVTVSYTYRGVTKTKTYTLKVVYETYTLKYYYYALTSITGRVRVQYYKKDGTQAWGTTTTATSSRSNTITVTAAKSTKVTLQIYNDSDYTKTYAIKQSKNGKTTQLGTKNVTHNSNTTYTTGNLTPGTDGTLTIWAEVS